MTVKSKSISTGLFFAASSLIAFGCSKSATTASSTAAVVANSGQAVSKAMSTISSSAPQVKTATVVTSNWDVIRKQLDHLGNLILPKAFASNGSLSAIWGTSGSTPTLSTQVTLPNEYFGGVGTGVTQTNLNTFTVTAANATAGATYTNNGATFTVTSTIAGATTLVATSTSGSPGPSGTLTKATGGGDATITFSVVAQNLQFSCTNAAAYCPVTGTLFNTSEALVDYIGQELNSSFKNTNGASITIFGRLNSALSIGCGIGTLITDLDTDGLPTVGAHALNFPADTSATIYQQASAGGCGMDTNMAGQTLNVTFSAVNGNANYTKMFTVNVGNTINIYLKLDKANGVFNFMQVENAIGSGRYAGSRTMLHMTNLNVIGGSKIAFEYIASASNCTAGTSTGNSLANCGTVNGDGTGSAVSSGYSGGQWQSGFEFHRGFIDQANDVAYLFSSKGSPGKSNGAVDTTHVAMRAILTAAGKPVEISSCTASTCSQNIAVSFGFVGEKSGNGTYSVGENVDTVNTTNYNGCVTVNSLQPTDDNTLATCGTSTGVTASSAATNMDAIRAHYSADALTSLVAGSTATTVFPFTDGSDIYTAHLDF